MKVLFLTVASTSSEHPSATRGFTALAHDLVRWADSDPRWTTARYVLMTRAVKSVLSGKPESGLRAIRPRRTSSTRGQPPTLLFDDIAAVMRRDALASSRMRDIVALLETAAKRGHVPSPLMDTPERLDWRLADVDADTAGAVVTACACQRFEGSGHDARTQFTQGLEELLRSPPDIIVLPSSAQVCWIEHVTRGRIRLASATVLPLVDFVRRENLTIAPKLLRATCASSLCEANSVVNATGLVAGLASVCGATFQRIIDSGVRSRCMMILEGVAAGPAGGSDGAGVVGGLVLDPVECAVHRPVCVMDFRSLYPSIVVALGLGSHLGLPRIVSELMAKRRSTPSAALASACKLMANAFYGQLASRTSSIFDPELAGRITQAGREHLRSLADFVCEKGGTVLYGDTDSILATFDGAIDCASARKACQAVVDEFNGELVPPMHVALQDVFSNCVFLSKKKYIARSESGELISVGTPNARTDWPDVAKEGYATVMALILSQERPQEVLDSVIAAGQNIMCASGIHRFVACRRIADKGSSSHHAEIARCESLREDGAPYETNDLIEFVLQSHPISKSDVCIAARDAEDDRVARRAYVRMFSESIFRVLHRVFGEDTAKSAKERLRDSLGERRPSHNFTGEE